jgi:hypothetical protein
MWNFPTNKQVGGGVGERLHLGRLWTLERELHLGLLGMLLDREERQQLPRVFAKAKISCSSSVQQLQLPCARSKSVLDHKRTSSTTTWRVGRGGSCCYTVLHSRLHRIETKAALRDHGKCKFSCVVPLYVLPSSHNTCES